MPLLQGQPFRLIKPPDNLQPDQEVYVIQHTGEKFIGKSDYEDRLALYSQSIWSCQCTGKSGLTHQEAWTSEQKVRVQLEGSFPAPLRGPILSIVHQSTAPLDQLVEAAHNHCNARFHRGEELELKSPQPIKVKVVRVHKGKGEASPQKTVLTNGCSPPSNRTMNGSGNGIAENGCSSSSPSDGMKGKEDSPGKKMLPYLYDVAIIGDDRTITEVPADHLQRVNKIPPKEHFRLFVRANAIRPRSSSTTPWMVRDDLVRQYNIPSKLPSIFNMKPQPQKRKAEEPLVGEIIKKPKEEIEPQPTVEIKPTPILSPIQITAASGEQKIRKKPGPKPGSKHSPKKVDESGEPKVLKKRGPKPGSKRIPKKDLTNYFIKTEEVTIIKIENGSVPRIAPVTPVKDEVTEKKRGRPPKMRQSSLHDIKTLNKNTAGANKSQKASPRKSPIKKRVMTPEQIMNLPLMRKLVYEHKHLKGIKGSGRKLVYTMDLAIKKLNREQIRLIPDESLREDLLARQTKVIEQKILADMSPEDKEEYLKQKAKDEAERRRLAKSLENMKVEDKNLNDLKPLPQPKMVPTPEVIPNSLFGDIVMVTEFLQCYRDLLMTEEEINLSTSQLMEALAAGPNGFKATADIFCILLRTIITDETSKNIKELKVPLRDLPVTYQTATEFTRQFLRRQDPDEKDKDATEKEDEEDDDEEEEFVEEIELSDELINKLEEHELFELEITEVISMLKALCHRVMTTNTVADFYDELEEKYNQLHRENASIKKMKKKEVLDEKERKKEERQQKKLKKVMSPKKGRGRPKGSGSPKKSLSPTKPGTITNFYKKPEEGEEDTDMASRVKRQRKTAMEKKQERQEEIAKRREERERRQIELEALALVKHNESIARRCEEIISKRELVSRQQPLGLDRDHNRYWLFHDTTPGVFVEKGWVDQATMYSVAPEFAEPSTSEVSTPTKQNSDEEDEKPLIDIKEQLAEDSPKKMQAIREPGTRGRAKFFIEDVNALTIPSVGQNLWFYFNTMEEIDALIDSLADKGLRESQLKEALIKNKEKIEANLLQKWEPLGEDDLQDGRQQIMETVRDDIIQIEREIIEGWFGAVPNYDEWEKKTNEAETIQDLGKSLIEVQKHMQKKFCKNFMKPITGVMNSVINAETDQQIGELEECEPRAVQRWKTEVENCQTFSRLHMLVGMFDSCIRWEKSRATKKCKICRSKDKSDPLVLCDKCEGSYHWYCLRPQLREEPAAPWFCSGCTPKKSKRVESSSRGSRKFKDEVLDDSEEEASEEEEAKQEEVCRICFARMGLIFCSTCPAAYHSECHSPPLTSRARKDWKCVECVKNPPKPKPERKRNSIARFFDKSKSKKSKKRQYNSMDDSEDELDKKSHRKSKSSKQTRSGRSSKRSQKFGESDEDEDESPVASRRSSRNTNRKRYIESDEEEEDEAEEEEAEEEAEAEEAEEEAEAEEAEEEEGDDEEEEDQEGEEKEDGTEEKEDHQEEGSEEEEDAEQDDDKEGEDVENEEEEKEHDSEDDEDVENEEEEKDNDDDDDNEDVENEEEEKEHDGEDDEDEDEGEDEEDENERANEESEESNATSDED